jgi:exportin-1
MFKDHLRDFLVQTKQFASQDNAELYAEEVAARAAAERQRLDTVVPGIIPPNERPEEMMDA